MPSRELDTILREIENAGYAEALTGGAALLTVIGGALLKKLGLEAHGKADVTFEADEATVIRITWPQEEPPDARHA